MRGIFHVRTALKCAEIERSQPDKSTECRCRNEVINIFVLCGGCIGGGWGGGP